MAGYRILLSLILAASCTSPAWTQFTRPGSSFPPNSSADAVTKVYPLNDLGDDPNLCKWIAETIPQMIQPDSWQNAEGKKTLSYYAPGKVLVICQTPAVHTQVEDFLNGLRKAMPARRVDASVVPAQFVAPDAPRVGPVQASQAYPIPLGMKAPKHLFHFIIRYEGEGIIDSNVTQFAKTLRDAGNADSGLKSYSTPATVLPASEPLAPAPQYPKSSPYMPTTNTPRMPVADEPRPLEGSTLPSTSSQPYSSPNALPPPPPPLPGVR